MCKKMKKDKILVVLTGGTICSVEDGKSKLYGLGRVVIPKEIRRTMRTREGDPLDNSLTPFDRFCWAIHSVVERAKAR